MICMNILLFLMSVLLQDGATCSITYKNMIKLFKGKIDYGQLGFAIVLKETTR